MGSSPERGGRRGRRLDQIAAPSTYRILGRIARTLLRQVPRVFLTYTERGREAPEEVDSMFPRRFAVWTGISGCLGVLLAGALGAQGAPDGSSAALRAKGRSLYANYCARCHG